MSKHPLVKPYLKTHSLVPENQETPIPFIPHDNLPTKLFYRRNHFSYPALPHSNYWLPINGHDAFPVTTLNVNSTIQLPLHMEILDTGKHLIKGIAWTGKGHITQVEISTNQGLTWTNAEIKNGDEKGYGLVSWSYLWTVDEPGEYSILSKATDSFNRTQPSRPFWNRKGYGYHAVDKISVKVE